ncbi:hypothetical protein Tco_0592228, partial [Tanacetum coccineum]
PLMLLGLRDCQLGKVSNTSGRWERVGVSCDGTLDSGKARKPWERAVMVLAPRLWWYSYGYSFKRKVWE